MEQFETNNIQTFNKPTFIYPMDQMKYEYTMQELAGFSPNTNFEQVRTQAAELLKEADEGIYTNAVESGLVNESITPETAVAFDSVYEPPVRDPNISLETIAADNQLAEAYSEEPDTALFAGLNPEVGDDDTLKAVIFNRFKQRMEGYYKDGSMWAKVGGLATEGLVPFMENISEQTPGSLDFLRTSKKDSWDKMMADAYNLSAEQYSNFLEGLSEYLVSLPSAESESIYRRGMETKDWGEEVWTALDTLTFGMASVAKAAGRIAKTVDVTSSAIKEGSKATKLSEGIATAVKGGTLKDMNFNNSVAHTMSDGRVLDVVDDIVEASRITPTVADSSELNIIMDAARKDVYRNAVPSLGDPVDYLWTDAVEVGDAGQYLYHALFGPSAKGEGGGFVSEKIAQNFAKNKLKLDKGSYTIYKAPGDGSGYYVDVVRGLSEEPLRGVETSSWKDFLTQHQGFLGKAERWLAGSTVRSTEEVSRANEALRKKNVVVDKLNEYWKKNGAKSKEAKAQVEAAYIEGQKKNEGMGEWLTEAEQDALGMSEEAKKEYKARKVINDTSYVINNDFLNRQLTAEGFGTDVEGMIVREINPKSVTHDMWDRMVVRSEAQKLSPVNISGQKAYKMLESDKYKLVEVHTSEQNARLLDYNFKLVPTDSWELKPLPRFIMKYAEGGPRSYSFGSYVIKAGRGWYDGEKFLNSAPISLGAIVNKKAAEEAAEDWGKLWDIAKKYDGKISDHAVEVARDLEAAELKRLNINSSADIEDLVRSADNPGGVLDITDTEYRPRIVQSGEEIVYKNGRQSIATAGTVWEDPAIELANNQWKFGKGRRSKLLTDLYDQPAKMKSFEEMTARSIQKAANAGVLGDLKRYYESRFRRDFLEVIDTKNGRYNPNALSDTTLIKTADILPESAVAGEETKAKIRAAKRFQEIYNNVTNVRTKADQAVHEAMTNLSKKLTGRGVMSTEMAEKISEVDPSKAIRGIAFQSAMGFWNTAQGWKQMLGATYAFAAHPIEASRAILSYIPVRAMYKYKDTHPTFYKFFKKMASGFGLYDEKALESFMNFMDQYGTLSSIKRLPGIDEARLHSITNSKMWKSQYFFTEMGTNFNYSVCDIMAFMEQWKKTGGKLSKADLMKIVQRSDDLYINMGKATQSSLQKSTVGSWVTQWLSYPMRAMEMALNRRLTVSERLSMAAGQLTLWGVGGTFLDDETRLAAYDWLTNSLGVDQDTANIAINGTVTYYGREAGVEISEGLEILDLLKNQLMIYKLFADQEFVAPKVPAGNFVGVIGSMFNAIHDFVYPDTGNFNTLLYLKRRATDKTLPTGLRNAAKAALMLSTQRAWNNAGDVIKDDATTRDAVYQVLGFGPTETSEMYYMKLYEDAESDAINNFIEKLQPYLEEYYMIDVVGNNEDTEETRRKLTELENRMQEDYRMFYKSIEDTWGTEAATKFQAKYAKIIFKDFDENKREKTMNRLYITNERKFNTIEGFMNKEKK